jgi:diaminopimelate epimerase
VRLTLPAPSAAVPLAVEAAGTALEGWSIVAGVPHFVLAVENVARAPLEIWGPALRRHPAFGAAGTNVDLAERRPDGVGVRTWERGVEGETLACGSGAIAAACVARRLGWVGGTVRVVPASGIPLLVDLPGPADAPEAAVLEGDARWIFDCTLAPEATEGFEA